jgi:hypothetical protein
MLKLLIILALSIYVLSKIGGFFFRIGAASQNRNPYQQRDGNNTVNPSSKKEKKGNIKGGDYVDYEEVK